MSNYNESNISGTQWTRASQVRIHNPLGGTPSIQFKEENVINADGKNIITRGGTLTDKLVDPSLVFNLLNPADGTVVGTATYGEVYAILNSLYRHLASIRDESQTP